MSSFTAINAGSSAPDRTAQGSSVSEIECPVRLTNDPWLQHIMSIDDGEEQCSATAHTVNEGEGNQRGNDTEENRDDPTGRQPAAVGDSDTSLAPKIKVTGWDISTPYTFTNPRANTSQHRSRPSTVTYLGETIQVDPDWVAMKIPLLGRAKKPERISKGSTIFQGVTCAPCQLRRKICEGEIDLCGTCKSESFKARTDGGNSCRYSRVLVRLPHGEGPDSSDPTTLPKYIRSTDVQSKAVNGWGR